MDGYTFKKKNTVSRLLNIATPLGENSSNLVRYLDDSSLINVETRRNRNENAYRAVRATKYEEKKKVYEEKRRQQRKTLVKHLLENFMEMMRHWGVSDVMKRTAGERTVNMKIIGQLQYRTTRQALCHTQLSTCAEF